MKFLSLIALLIFGQSILAVIDPSAPVGWRLREVDQDMTWYEFDGEGPISMFRATRFPNNQIQIAVGSTNPERLRQQIVSTRLLTTMLQEIDLPQEIKNHVLSKFAR
ncbi:MAG: hypothetical protein V4534_00025 [Myxococcota bacterium]